jgi:hypothetical protein
VQLLFDVLVEVHAERFDAQCQKNDANNEVDRFEHEARHSQWTLISALRLLITDNGLSASSGSPVDLIADPLGADGKHNHHERSEGNPKDR